MSISILKDDIDKLADDIMKDEFVFDQRQKDWEMRIEHQKEFIQMKKDKLDKKREILSKLMGDNHE